MENRYLLISDLDGTLLGDEAALEQFRTWYYEHGRSLALAYNSGRLVDDLLECVDQTGLPLPVAVIGGVGTQIWQPGAGLLADWPACHENWNAQRIGQLLARFPQLELQPVRYQSPFKVSYYVYDASSELLQQIRDVLAEHGIRASLIYSSNRDLDILPEGVDKGSASRFLAKRLGYPPHRVLISGDTGNDLAMFGNGFLGIVVGNAHEELRNLVHPHVYQAREPFARGVLEGILYWMNQERMSGG
ncbi:MAG: mannosylfructose-phosphate phosphatase [Pirellulaceae bacterium]|nr:MAG: mannosylfructose-phosphate phosphatase [Pirellulaceae bacterium]